MVGHFILQHWGHHRQTKDMPIYMGESGTLTRQRASSFAKAISKSTILWLSLLLLIFHAWCNFNSTTTTTTTTISNHHHHHLINRKVLLASKFNFTPFLPRHHHRHHHRRHVPVQPEPAESEIDPRYGVDKRLVPTGPNPLHH
ncbi:hypothetical protein L1049_027631 [Liquidambar formosana]|uniref:CLAVATA3/ESR (CLE)-related protein 13 n=1 Tax=Liquidambar formosana TaxID=63359 RepID=A0AAP0RJ08_LIQFO